MILADIPSPSPSFMGNWIFAAFAFCSVIAFVVAVLSFFATRRDVDELKASNVEAWKKMESDRVEATHAIANVDSKMSGIRATVDSVQNTVNLMNLKLDRIKDR